MQEKDIKKITDHIIAKTGNKDLKIALTGSLALKALGLMEREAKDLDFLIACDSKEQALAYKSKINHLDKSKGLQTSFMKRGIWVDIFFVERLNICDAKYLDIAIANPLETLRVKANFLDSKSIADLNYITKKIYAPR